MPRDLVIDGYNLMHAAGLARATYGPGDLERCHTAVGASPDCQSELAEKRHHDGPAACPEIEDARRAPS